MRGVVDTTSRFLAWVRRNRRIRPRTAPVKVNLGSGLSVAPGWIHLDASLNALCAGWPSPVLRVLYRASDCRRWYREDDYLRRLRGHAFVHHRLEYGLPFDDASVDCVYSSHALEHCYRDDAQRVLVEAHRVLKSGGWIRVAVPDLEHAIALYRAGDKEQALGYFFASSRAGSSGRHQYMYDLELLRDLLKAAGFAEIRRRAFREGVVSDIQILDNRPEETLFVEARKP